MTRRSVSRGTILGLSVGLVLMLGVALGGCYGPPKPDCGFRCGPAQACPADYTCGNDNRCHLNGSSPTLQCGTADASVADAPSEMYSPRVILISPGRGESEVGFDRPILAGFDVDVMGVSELSFLVSATGVPVSGTVTYEPSEHRAIFFPSRLPTSSQIDVTLTPAIRDPATGRTLQPTSWFFETAADGLPPVVSNTSPADGAVGVSVAANISVTFDEPVQNVDTASFVVSEGGGTIGGTITMSNGNRTATFDPTASLAAAATITVTLSSSITDATGNPLAATSFSFTTAP
ncbi:MAG: Ig-like domain-containing protein [Deltaproteobacteria bacterium]|nr:Ig-like domain-containing protein [Deltaproteobacteria bacterium]MDQ3296077.1 Ig-like domain-containing protein [Myxococcota bacterium]